MRIQTQIKKNLLDIEERKYRGYYTTLIIISLTFVGILVSLFAMKEIGEQYQTLLYLFFMIPLLILYYAFDCERKAEEAIQKIKRLK